MASDAIEEILAITGDQDITETGGAHNQKGIEFQKNWALIQMFHLEEEGQNDFLFLFEAIQDIAIFDSQETPRTALLYQIKKKDRGEWSWNSLTNLHVPDDPTKAPKPKKSPTDSSKPTRAQNRPLFAVADSPIGKLHAAVSAFRLIKSEGRFISNAGCNVVMSSGANAATSLPVALTSLPTHFRDLLSQALASAAEAESPLPDLARLHLEKVSIPVDDPVTYTVGKVHAFLVARSREHAGQAKSLVDALLVKLAPLGSRTATCETFEQLKSQHGYSRDDFINALRSLEQVLDIEFYLGKWLDQLITEGMGIIEATRIRSAATAIYRRQLLGHRLPEEHLIQEACDVWLSDKNDPSKLLPFFKEALDHLSPMFVLIKKSELQAHFALRAIIKCVDQN